MIRNRSQKFWDIYQGYLLTFEQGAQEAPESPRKFKEAPIVHYLTPETSAISLQVLTVCFEQ